MKIASVIQITKAVLARISVGRAARAIRAETGSPLSTETPKSPWRTPLVAPLIPFGRKFGQPDGPRKAAGGGKIPRSVSETSGLQAPIQRQYWTGIGWSRPQAFLNCSLSSFVTRGLLAK